MLYYIQPFPYIYRYLVHGFILQHYDDSLAETKRQVCKLACRDVLGMLGFHTKLPRKTVNPTSTFPPLLAGLSTCEVRRSTKELMGENKFSAGLSHWISTCSNMFQHRYLQTNGSSDQFITVEEFQVFQLYTWRSAQLRL